MVHSTWFGNPGAWVPLCISLLALALLSYFLPYHLLAKYGLFSKGGENWKIFRWSTTKFHFGYAFMFAVATSFVFGLILTFAFVPKAETPGELGFSVALVLLVMIPTFLVLSIFRLATGPLQFHQITKEIKGVGNFSFIWLIASSACTCIFFFMFGLMEVPHTGIDLIVSVTPVYVSFLVLLIGALLFSIMQMEASLAEEIPDLERTFLVHTVLYMGQEILVAMVLMATWAKPETPAKYAAYLIISLITILHYAHLSHNYSMNICLDPSYREEIPTSRTISGLYVAFNQILIFATCGMLSAYPNEIPLESLAVIVSVLVVPHFCTALISFLYLNRRQSLATGLYRTLFLILLATTLSTIVVCVVLMSLLGVGVLFHPVVTQCVGWTFVILCLLFFTRIWFRHAKDPANLNIFRSLLYTRFKWDADTIDDLILETRVEEQPLEFLKFFVENPQRFGMSRREFILYYLDRTLLLGKQGQRIWRKARLVMMGARDQNSSFQILPSDLQKMLLMFFGRQLTIPWLVSNAWETPEEVTRWEERGDVDEYSALFELKPRQPAYNTYGTV